jgi:Protein of unknown function (DUF2934)
MTLSAAEEQTVRERAHAIWEAEGRPEGRHAEHWQMALSEFEREKKAPNTEKVVDSPAVTVTPGETPILQKKSSRSTPSDPSAENAPDAPGRGRRRGPRARG